MKASELRLGNWVASGANKENPETWIIGKVESISSTSSRFEQIEVETEESFEWFFKDSYFGIPLTEQWLLKFGFQKTFVNKDSGYSEFKLQRSDYEFEFDIDDTSFYFYLNGKRNIHVKYVHQLQNLFFALTQKELQIKETAQ